MQLQLAEPVPLPLNDMVCDPVGVQLKPLGSVRVPDTLEADEPDTETVVVKISPCVTLVGRLMLVIEIEPAAKTIVDKRIRLTAIESKILSLILNSSSN